MSPLDHDYALGMINADDEMAALRAEIRALRLMALHSAWVWDTQGASKARLEIAELKFWGAQVLHNVIDRAIQVHGALGYSTDTPLAHMYQHARWARFADGADEIHQMRIAQRTIAAYRDEGSTRRATGDLPL